MTYFNYHAIAKYLIKSNHLLAVAILDSYHHIKPAMVLYFDNHRPIPIRQYKWKDYLPLIQIEIDNKTQIDLNQL